MKKKVIPVLGLAMLGLGSYATTYMMVKQSDGTIVEYDVENVVEVTYRTDSIPECEDCQCDFPDIRGWRFADGSPTTGYYVDGGSTIVIYGEGMSRVKRVAFGEFEAEIAFPLSDDGHLVLKTPIVKEKIGFPSFYTAKCPDGRKVDVVGVQPVSLSAPCVTMCDNEMAVKTLNVVGSSLFAPLVAKFWDGKDHSIIASTEDGSIILYDDHYAKIIIPEGVADNGTIVFENAAGSSETNFIFHDTRNLLITHDDEDLNLFNQNRPDIEMVDEETGEVIGLPIPKDILKETVFKSENTNGDFSIFHDLAGYTAWTYSPKGDANPEGVAPKYPTPFGCFSESIDKGETSFNDYVIKFEVFVPDEYPMSGNSLSIGFYGDLCWELREFCALWQPSVAHFAKDEDGVWLARATFDNWTTGGDWMTITIPMEELRYNFTAKSYYCSPQNGRRIVDGSDDEYSGFGDRENGLSFFDYYGEDYVGSLMSNKGTKAIQSIGIVFGNADQPNTSNEPLIAVDNLRIVPKDNNGGVYPMLKWGIPSRDFYRAPSYLCK